MFSFFKSLKERAKCPYKEDYRTTVTHNDKGGYTVKIDLKKKDPNKLETKKIPIQGIKKTGPKTLFVKGLEEYAVKRIPITVK